VIGEQSDAPSRKKKYDAPSQLNWIGYSGCSAILAARALSAAAASMIQHERAWITELQQPGQLHNSAQVT